jgi:hypothetical protein
MAEQYDSFNEKSRQVDRAMKFTRGDIIKAKEMVSGQYLDIMVIKGKFLVDKKGVSGMFLAFFNYIHEYIPCVEAVISSKPIIFDKTRIFDDWKTLRRDITAYKSGPDMMDSQNFTYFLIDSFIGYDVFPDVQENNLDRLTKTITEIIAKSFNTVAIKCQIETETTNSLVLDIAGVPVEVPGGMPQEEAPLTEEDQRLSVIEKEAKYVIEGKAILSPVRGKIVSDLIPGDKIRVMLPGNDMVTSKIMKLLNAYDSDGGRLPVTGRIKAKVPLDKGGYMLYAFVAKGVLAKIFEEENIKLMIDAPLDEFKEASPRLDNWLIYIMALVLGLIILCGIILFQIL